MTSYKYRNEEKGDVKMIQRAIANKIRNILNIVQLLGVRYGGKMTRKRIAGQAVVRKSFPGDGFPRDDLFRNELL